MFRSAENLRLAADMRALQRVAAPWRKARSTWFDGTPESLEARLAATERVLTHARSGVTQAHIALEREASIARAELKEASHRLMVDFLDDGARAFKGSKRVAGSRYFNDAGEPLMSGEQARFEDALDQDSAADRAYDDHYDDYGPDYDDYDDDDDEGTIHGQHPNEYREDKEWMDFRASRHGSRRVAGADEDYAREEREFWNRHVKDTGPGIGDEDDDEPRPDDYPRHGSRRVAGIPDEHVCDHCGLISEPQDVYEEGRCPDCGQRSEDPRAPLPDYMQPGYRSPYRENNHGHWEDDLMEGGGPGAPQDGPGRHRSEAARVRRRAAPMASPGDGGSAIAPVEMGGGASASIPGAIGKMIWNGSTMTGQEPPANFAADLAAAKMGYRSAAYDMVECSRCGKEIPDDGNQVVDTSTPGSYTHDKKGGTLEDFCPDCMPKKYKRRKSFDPPSVGGRNAAFLPDFDDSLLFGD